MTMMIRDGQKKKKKNEDFLKKKYFNKMKREKKRIEYHVSNITFGFCSSGLEEFPITNYCLFPHSFRFSLLRSISV